MANTTFAGLFLLDLHCQRAASCSEMSSLAAQIARAAVEAPIAGHVKAAKQGGRASFLYDGVTALEIDVKTSHEVGINGEELTLSPTLHSLLRLRS